MASRPRRGAGRIWLLLPTGKVLVEGVLLGAVGGVAFGLFQATNRRGNRGVDPYLATFTVMVVSLVALAVLAAVIEQPSRLLSADPVVLATFAGAGLLHFFLGWTLLALAQQRVGAARTGVITGAAPVFGTAIAFVFIREAVRPLALVGVLLVVAGVALLAGGQGKAGGAAPASRTGWLFAALTGMAWGTSPVLVRYALSQMPTPLSGVTVGMAAAALAYAVALIVRRRRQHHTAALPARTVGILALAGLLVASGIGTQWLALDVAPVAIVLALNQLAVPVVLVAAPLIVGTQAERLTRLSMIGAGLTAAGTIVIITSRATSGA